MTFRQFLSNAIVVALLAGLTLSNPGEAAQQVVSNSVDADTYIERDDNDAGDPPDNDTNYGDSVEMLVKAGSDGGLTSDVRKALIRFDVTGKTINPNQLYVFEVTTNDDDRANQIHTINAITDPALQGFEELGITWNNSPDSAKEENASFNSAGPAVGTFGPVLASPHTAFQTTFFFGDAVGAVFEDGGKSLVTFGIGGSGNSTLGLQTKETTSTDLTPNQTPSPARLLTFDAINSAASGSVMAGSTWTGGAVPVAGNQYLVVDDHNVTADASATGFAGEALVISNGSLTYTANEVTVPLVVVGAGKTVSESLNGDFFLGNVNAPTLGRMILNGDLTVDAENGGDFGLDVDLSGAGTVTVNSTTGSTMFITSIPNFEGTIRFNGSGDEVLYEGPAGSDVTIEMNSTGTNRLALSLSGNGAADNVVFNQPGDIDHRSTDTRLMSPGAITANANITIDLTKTFDGNERRLFAANGWHGPGSITATGTPTDPTSGSTTLNEFETGSTSPDGPDATHLDTDSYAGTVTANAFLNVEVRHNIPSGEIIVNQNAFLEFGHRDVESLFTTNVGEVAINSGGSLEVGYEADDEHVPYNLQLTTQRGQSGDLTLTNGAKTIMQILGTDPHKFDTIVAEGTVNLDGTLQLLINPTVPSQTVICGEDGAACVYTPADGDTFEIISIGAETLLADYDGNGTVGTEDYEIWKETFGDEFDVTADGNGNGIVDAADFTVWRDSLGGSGSTTGSILGDFDSMVITDPGNTLAGFTVSKTVTATAVTLTINSTGGATAVPEPSALLLAGISLALGAGVRRWGSPRG